MRRYLLATLLLASPALATDSLDQFTTGPTPGVAIIKQLNPDGSTVGVEEMARVPIGKLRCGQVTLTNANTPQPIETATPTVGNTTPTPTAIRETYCTINVITAGAKVNCDGASGVTVGTGQQLSTLPPGIVGMTGIPAYPSAGNPNARDCGYMYCVSDTASTVINRCAEVLP